MFLTYSDSTQSHGDGLQILRYNVSKAYNSHLDWIEDRVSWQINSFKEVLGFGISHISTCSDWPAGA